MKIDNHAIFESFGKYYIKGYEDIVVYPVKKSGKDSEKFKKYYLYRLNAYEISKKVDANFPPECSTPELRNSYDQGIQDGDKEVMEHLEFLEQKSLSEPLTEKEASEFRRCIAHMKYVAWDSPYDSVHEAIIDHYHKVISHFRNARFANGAF